MNKAPQSASEITRLLQQDDLSDLEKNKRLMSLVYAELKAIARHKMRSERVDHTLTPTALVHEAYLRLVQAPDLGWQSRGHFFTAAAESMRRILIDSARARNAQKKGRQYPHTASVEQAAGDDAALAWSSDVLSLDAALIDLESRDHDMAAVVKLRFFAGLTAQDTALALDVSLRTVNRLWAAARAWLIAHM